MGQNLESKELNRILGKKIRLLRRMKEMTQVELARELGYSSSGTVSLIERGIKGMVPATILKAAEFFHVHPAVLFSPTEMDEVELEIVSALMLLLEDYKRHPKTMGPVVRILKRILLVNP